jgi:hypothetical protein
VALNSTHEVPTSACSLPHARAFDWRSDHSHLIGGTSTGANENAAGTSSPFFREAVSKHTRLRISGLAIPLDSLLPLTSPLDSLLPLTLRARGAGAQPIKGRADSSLMGKSCSLESAAFRCHEKSKAKESRRRKAVSSMSWAHESARVAVCTPCVPP